MPQLGERGGLREKRGVEGGSIVGRGDRCVGQGKRVLLPKEVVDTKVAARGGTAQFQPLRACVQVVFAESGTRMATAAEQVLQVSESLVLAVRQNHLENGTAAAGGEMGDVRGLLHVKCTAEPLTLVAPSSPASRPTSPRPHPSSRTSFPRQLNSLPDSLAAQSAQEQPATSPDVSAPASLSAGAE